MNLFFGGGVGEGAVITIIFTKNRVGNNYYDNSSRDKYGIILSVIVEVRDDIMEPSSATYLINCTEIIHQLYREKT